MKTSYATKPDASHVLFVSGNRALFVDAGGSTPIDADALYDALVSSDGLGATLAALVGGDLFNAPDFALVEFNEGARSHLFVRGAIAVAADGQQIDGRGVTTWVERDVDGAREIVIGETGHGLSLPVVSGAVRASGATLRAGARGEVPSAAQGSQDSQGAGPAGVGVGAGSAHAGAAAAAGLGSAAVASAGAAATQPPAPFVPPVPMPEPPASAPPAWAPESTAEMSPLPPAHDEASSLSDDAEPSQTDGAAAGAHAGAEDETGEDDDFDRTLGGLWVDDHDSAPTELMDAADAADADASGSAAHGADGDRSGLRGVSLKCSWGQSFELRDAVVFGRAPRAIDGVPESAELVTISGDTDISRSHVAVELKQGEVVVTDLHSRNGTLLHVPGKDPALMRGGEPVAVPDDTIIDLGGGSSITVVFAE